MRREAEEGGGKERLAAQHARGKLSARERLDLLPWFVLRRAQRVDRGRGQGQSQDGQRRGRSAPTAICLQVNRLQWNLPGEPESYLIAGRRPNAHVFRIAERSALAPRKANSVAVNGGKPGADQLN